MTIDLAKIKAAALAATQTPWEFWQGYVATDIDSYGGVIICERPRPSGGKFQKATDNNFKHIATANPAAVLELIERLEAAERDHRGKCSGESDSWPNIDAVINSAMKENKA